MSETLWETTLSFFICWQSNKTQKRHHQRLQRSRSADPAASSHLGYVHEDVVIVELNAVLVGTSKLRGNNIG